MTDPSLYVALGGWLGAILDRLRSGRPPLPDEISEQAAAIDASRFGALEFYRVQEWIGRQAHRSARIDEYLSEIHRRAQGQTWEAELWYGILLYIPTPLPAAIALDLLDRGIARGWFAHSWQEEQVWWRLVDEYPEAAHNLAINRYTSDAFEWHRVEEVLHQFPWDEIIGILATLAPSHDEKARQLAEYIRARGAEAAAERTIRRWHPSFRAVWGRVA